MNTATGEIAHLEDLLDDLKGPEPAVYPRCSHRGWLQLPRFRTGNTSANALHRRRIVKRLSSGTHPCIVPIDIANLDEATRAQLAKTGKAFITRNSRCPCGSGKRFKQCCYTGEDKR